MKIDDESKKRIERREKRKRKRGLSAIYMRRGEEKNKKLKVSHYPWHIITVWRMMKSVKSDKSIQTLKPIDRHRLASMH